MLIKSISSIKYPDLVPLVPRGVLPIRSFSRLGGYTFLLRASSRRFGYNRKKEFTKGVQLLGNGVIKE